MSINTNNPIHVLIADDHPIVRQGLAMMCATQPDIEMVAEAANGTEAVQLVEQHTPDVVVLDLMMPETDGLSALRLLRQRQPTVRVLVLTSFAEDEYVTAALEAGVEGFQLKDCTPKILLNAIRAVHRGERTIHPTIVQQMMQHYQKPAAPTDLATLTPRESEVLCLLGQGLSNREIAEHFVISTRTVTTHVRNIMAKLELANRTQVALFARDHGIG